MEVRNHSNKPSGIWVFDIEGDNLYDNITKAHCVWLTCPVTRMSLGFRPHEFKECLSYLERAVYTVAHNGIDFDIPAIRKLFELGEVKIVDTLTLACMLHPNRLQQSLDSWGKDLGNFKDDFGKTADWSVFTEEMYEYCYQDVSVTVDLFLKLITDAGYFRPLNEFGDSLSDEELMEQLYKVPCHVM